MIILTQSPGRLGNKLWTLANVLAFCLDNDLRLVHADMSGLDRIRKSFLAKQRAHRESPMYRAWLRIARKSRLHTSLTVKPREYVNLDQSPELKEMVRNGRPVQMAGYYLAAPDSLSRHQPAVIEALQFDPEVRREADRIRNATISRSSQNVAIHMRRGDYREFLGGMLYYSDEVYRSVADLVRTSFARPVRFHLFSDEVIPEQAFAGHDVVAHHGNAPEVDLAMMSTCDAIIGPSSSFSQWASFVGNVPIHVLDPETIEHLGTLSGFAESEFSVYGARRFGQMAATQIPATSAMVH